MPKGLKRAVSALLITFLVYCLLGFLLIPGIGLRVANQQLAQYATVPARLERIEFNPFSLELTLWGLRLGDEKNPSWPSAGCTPTCSWTACGNASCTWPTSSWKVRIPNCCSTRRASSTWPACSGSRRANRPSRNSRATRSAAHRPHPTGRGQPALPGPATERAGGLQLRSAGFRAAQPQHPARRRREDDPGRHRPERRPPRLGRRPDPGADHVQGPPERQGYPAQGLVALCPRQCPLVLENGVVSLSSDYRLDLSKEPNCCSTKPR